MAGNSTLAGTLANSLLQGITKVTVETAYLPKVELNDPFAPGPPSPLISLLKPKITVEVSNMEPIVMAPYGEPGPTKFPIVMLVFAAGTVALAFVAWRFLKRKG